MTTENMTDEEMRVAIAEALGWRWLELPGHHDPYWFASPAKYKGYLPIAFAKTKPEWNWQVMGGMKNLPDYLNSLELMHEAEKSLTDAEWDDYGSHLCEQLRAHSRTGIPQRRDFIHSTARQRALAFLAVKAKS